MATVSLRPVSHDDAKFLFDLLAARPKEANISHHSMPSYEDHVAFVDSQPYAAWYCVIALSLVGTIYLTKQDEIGVQILQGQQGRGFATAAIRALMKLHSRPRYLANISFRNNASARLFCDLGFTHLQSTYEFRP